MYISTMPRQKSGAPLYVSTKTRMCRDSTRIHKKRNHEETRSDRASTVEHYEHSRASVTKRIFLFFLHSRHRPTTRRRNGLGRAVSFERLESPVPRFHAAVSSHSCSSRRMNDSFATPRRAGSRQGSFAAIGGGGGETTSNGPREEVRAPSVTVVCLG